LDREQNTLYVGIKDLLVVLFGDGPDGSKAASACVGENNIEAAFLLLDLGEEAVEVLEIGGISADGLELGSADSSNGFIELRLTAAGDVDESPLLDEFLCRGQPDSRAAAGDESDLAFQFAWHLNSFGHF
jgi:hypothetical protein